MVYARRSFACATVTALVMALVHCGSDDADTKPPFPNDVNADADTADATTSDAPAFDGGSDAHWDFDASPRPVVCRDRPCVTSLTSVFEDAFCALLQDETVACWGQATSGQTGRGIDAGPYAKPTPERIAGIERIVMIRQNCALDRAGSTWCWGRAAYFTESEVTPALEWSPVKLPIPPATQVASTNRLGDDGIEATTCALVEGKLLCWGSNSDGQVAVPTPGAGAIALAPRPIDLPAGAAVRTVVLGRATLVLRDDGTLLTWGRHPALGRTSSLTPDPYPRQVLLSDVTDIDVSDRAACAIAGGVGYCWGPPFYQESPYSEPPLTRALPAPVATPEPLVRIATSGTGRAFPERSCGVGVSGDVYCWGSNAFGQAGDGTTNPMSPSSPPVKVNGLPAPAAEVRTTPLSTCALLTNGKVYCWGDNRSGQLGIGTLGGISPTPVEAHLP